MLVVAAALACLTGAALAQTPAGKPPAAKAGAGAKPAPAAAAAAGPSAAERFAACLACHGEGGRSVTPLTPSLAGQHAFYAITQLFLFREGRRSNAAMSAVAKDMKDEDLRAFSELISKLPPPPGVAAADVDGARMARGAALAARYHCGSCHGASFAGDQQVARIANQREDYLLMVLREFQAGKRLGYSTAMNETLAGIPAEGLGDLAYFLANLPAARR